MPGLWPQDFGFGEELLALRFVQQHASQQKNSLRGFFGVWSLPDLVGFPASGLSRFNLRGPRSATTIFHNAPSGGQRPRVSPRTIVHLTETPASAGGRAAGG